MQGAGGEVGRPFRGLKGDPSLHWSDSNTYNEKWSDSGRVLKVKGKTFANGLDVVYRVKRGVEDDSKNQGLTNWMNY